MSLPNNKFLSESDDGQRESCVIKLEFWFHASKTKSCPDCTNYHASIRAVMIRSREIN
jgi:hypothetical protein